MILKAGLYMSRFHAEFTLRLQETQRSLRITKRHPRNQHQKSGAISAAALQDKYMKCARLLDVHLRNCVRLQSSTLEMSRGLWLNKQTCRRPHQTAAVSLFSLHIIACFMLFVGVSVSPILD